MSVALTKQAAAHRLILCAVGMVREGSDPLATHIVASSALNILRETLESRGPGHAATAAKTGIYHAALAKSEGRAIDLPFSKTVDNFLDEVGEAIRSGAIGSASDIHLDMPPGYERQWLDHILRPFNFLKHAYRDPTKTLDEDDVKPVPALFHAITAYLMLFANDQLSDEIGEFLVSNDISLS